MNKLSESALTFVVTFGTALMALWQDVDTFGEISGPAYAVAFIGAVIAAANTRKARLNNA